MGWNVSRIIGEMWIIGWEANESGYGFGIWWL
jgi:hypothetical protein